MTETIEQEKTFLESFLEPMGGLETLTFAFWLSIGLLFLISLLKYWLLRENAWKEWAFMMLELPVDVCVVIITIIITGFMRSPDGTIDGNKAAIGIILVVISLVISVFCCIFRRMSMKYSYSNKKKSLLLSWLCAILDIIIALLWVSAIITTHG